ncbi:unnamed protein product [Litomosoides sigmodontis]|uniref:Uncharacterized protein n=1 Tax=Litomosoides sigmodontis TaxID=42156 RepID=A0A3P6SU85_LITSI|nr:unnamed protein product [Litomosoides sigmodontis]
MNLDKFEFVQGQSRNKVGGFVVDTKTRPPKPNEFHYRCNYLYGAASLLSSQSSGNSGLETLSKLYLREMKKLCLVEMIRLEKDFGRTVCKRCKKLFIAHLDGTQSVTVRLNKQKQIVRTCLGCGAKKFFLRNSTYLSRNERSQHQAETERHAMIEKLFKSAFERK